MPRGVYDRNKAHKNGQKNAKRRKATRKRSNCVAAESDTSAWAVTDKLVDRYPDSAHAKLLEQGREIVRLDTELRQHREWLRDQGDAYMDVIDRLIYIHRRYGGDSK